MSTREVERDLYEYHQVTDFSDVSSKRSSANNRSFQESSYANTATNSSANNSNREIAGLNLDNIVPDQTTSPRESQKTIGISSKFFVDNELGMDEGYAWIVDIGSFFVQFFIVGTIFSFGVFMPIYVDYFNASQSAVSWAGSLSSFLMVFLGLLIGAFDDRYGNNNMIFVSAILTALGYFLASYSTELWHLYLTQGVIVGLGYSAGNVSAVSIVGQWFKVHRALAVGIAVAGAGLGQFTMSLVLNSIINQFGWRGALQIVALINLIGLTLCGCIIRRRLPTSHHLIIINNCFDFLHNKRFMLLACSQLVYQLGMFVPYSYIPIYAESKGISKSNAVLILSLSGVSNALGRIFIGELADLFGRIPMLILSMVSAGIVTICWLSCDTFNSLLAFGIVYGFCGGGTISLLPSIAVDILGMKKVSQVVGLLYTICSPGSLLSTPIAGFVYDAYGSYDPMIILTACFMFAAALIVILQEVFKEYLEGDLPTINDDQQLQQTEEDNKTNPDKHFDDAQRNALEEGKLPNIVVLMEEKKV